MDEQTQIFGEQGAIVDEQVPLQLQNQVFEQNFDYEISNILNQDSKCDNSHKEELPTSFVGQENFFVEQNGCFLEIQNFDKKIDSSEDALKQKDNKNLEEIFIGLQEVEEGVKIRQLSEIQVGRRPRNKRGSQTKNIPKNYGKQIIKFIQTHEKLVTPILTSYKITYPEFLKEMKICKKKMNRIIDLRNIWTEHCYAVPVRIISEHFLRKYSYQWIFNSRIEDIRYPIKYRKRIIQGVKKPVEFEYLKEYS